MGRFFLFGILYASVSFALEYQITSKVANGTTAVVSVEEDGRSVCTKVEYKGVNYPLFLKKETTQKYAFIPVSYYEKKSAQEMKLICTENQEEKQYILSFDIVDGEYAKENIHVSNNKVHPKAKKVQQRISSEYKEAMKIYHTHTPYLYIKEPFTLPLDSKITSDFGKARVYNNTLKGYHSGTDFRAQVGTPIDASNAGKVVLVKKRFYSGGTVLIDHGEGIYTCYFHLSKFLVKEGDMVRKNQVIGLSGKSGRVTGPHLHFSARVDGVQVDPLQLIHVMNTTLFKEEKQ